MSFLSSIRGRVPEGFKTAHRGKRLGDNAVQSRSELGPHRRHRLTVGIGQSAEECTMKFRSGLPAIAILAMTTLLLTGGSVLAGYGSVAYDQDTRKQGVSSDEATQQDAERAAMKKCGSENCKLRFKIPAKMCAAFATPENGPAWG